MNNPNRYYSNFRRHDYFVSIQSLSLNLTATFTTMCAKCSICTVTNNTSTEDFLAMIYDPAVLITTAY